MIKHSLWHHLASEEWASMINDIQKRYIANQRKFVELENYVYSGKDIVSQIIHNSAVKKELKDENEEILARIRRYGQAIDEITNDERDWLEDFAYELSNHTLDIDPGVAEVIRLILLERAKQKGDTNDIVAQLYKLGHCWFCLSYRRSMYYMIEDGNRYGEEALLYEDQYDSLSAQGKEYFRRAHNNATSLRINAHPDIKIRACLKILEKNKALKESDPEGYPDEKYERDVAIFNNNICEAVYKFIDDIGVNDFNIEAFYKASRVNREYIERLHRNSNHIAFQFYLFDYIAEYYKNTIGLNELIQRLDKLSQPTETDDIKILISRAFQINAFYLRFLYKSDSYTADEKRRILEKKIKFAMDYAEKLGTRFDEYAIDIVVRRYFTMMREICEYEQIKDIAFYLMIHRHKQTYIHTITVGRISEVVAKYLLLTDRSYFSGCFGEETDEEILSRVREMARLHDIGKYGCIELIQNFSRNLTDTEFKAITHHPQYGLMLLPESTPKYIKDGILYHHLWHNGQKGYPANLPPTKNQPLVDILSFADCLDAATDFIGRPYHMAKTLDDMKKELEGFKGTRYGAQVVDVLNDADLFAKIESIIGPEREALIQDVYQPRE